LLIFNAEVQLIFALGKDNVN
jgi:hypothetical protein